MFYVLGRRRMRFKRTDEDRQRFIRCALAAVRRTEHRLMGREPPVDGPAGINDVLDLADFAADLVACVQIYQWEKAGQTRYLSGAIPSFSEAIEDFRNRIQNAPDDFFHEGPSDTALFKQVSAVRCSYFRFSPELGAVLFVADLDEDALVEAVAQLAYRLRHR